MRGLETKTALSVVVGWVAAWAIWGGAADAAELQVPGAFLTIQSAIDSAIDGDVVVLQPGVYTGAGNTALNFDGRLITVRSIDPSSPGIVAATIIDGEGVNNAFYFDSGETPEASVEGLTVQNGPPSVYGMIRCGPFSWPTFADCVLRDCAGVVIRATQQGKITLDRCVLENNTAGNVGSGNLLVAYPLSAATVRHCIFRNNVGPAISFDGGFLIVEDTRIEHTTQGSGISVMQSTQVEIRRTWLVDNESPGNGGGLLLRPPAVPGPVTIESCVFLNNSSGGKGGALYVQAGTLNGNIAVDNCTFAGNSAAEAGGTLGISGRQISLHNCILWNGAAPDGSELYLGPGLAGGGPGAAVPPATVVIDHSIVTSLPAPALISDGATLVIGDGVINDDPLFLDEEAGDVHLRSNSPARDAGDPGFEPSPEDADIDGEPRLFGEAVDLGADELNFLPIAGDLDGDGDVDLADYVLFAECLGGAGSPPASGCNSDADLDMDGDVDLKDYAEFSGNAE